MQKKTVVICGFPGIGKSTFYKNNPDMCLDSDSSNFSWLILENGDKIRNPDFPNNYINHIKDNIGKYDIILVSTHAEVIEALRNNDIIFNIVIPSKDRKEEFLTLYKNRGNDQNFINLIDKNWDIWLDDLLNVRKYYLCILINKSFFNLKYYEDCLLYNFYN